MAVDKQYHPHVAWVIIYVCAGIAAGCYIMAIVTAFTQ